MQEIELLRKKLARERRARKEAERLLEDKALELFHANGELRNLNANLKHEVDEKTRQLERQKARLQTIVESAQDIMYIISPQGHFRFVNAIAEKKLGLPKEQLIGRHYAEFVRPDFRNKVEQFYLRQLEEKRSITYLEFPVPFGAGSEMWLGQHVSVVREGDKITGLTAIARDVTERKQAERELSTINARLSIILESMQEGILVEDEKRRIVLVNQEFCNIFGIEADPGMLVGADNQLVTEQSKSLFRDPASFELFAELMLRDRRVSDPVFLETHDGRIIELRYMPIFRNQEYNGQLWRYEDVTEKKLAERKIRESEEKYRGIMENMELGLMEVDKQGIITKVYDRFCEMTGYTPEELVGKNAREVFLPGEFHSLMDHQERARLEGATSVYESQLIAKSGERRWMLISGAPFYNEAGEVIGSMGIHYDITNQKNLQRDLEIARIEAEKARDAEKDFLANMSHEIRNPINSIIGMTNLLFDTTLEEEQVEYLNNIKYSSDILLALISDILDISKITEGKMELNPRNFDPWELINAIGRTTAFRLQSKPVEFKLDIDPQLPERLVGDTTFINQSLLNLLGNATKFTKRGFIQLQVDLMEEREKDVTIKFSVRDTGIGIAPEKLGSVFERFSQVGKAHKETGTGLGLPITKKLVELQGGEIWVESQVGEGTTFSFYLPLAKGEIPQKGRPAGDEGVAVQAEANRKLHFLIVEDNPVNRMYLERIIKKWGHTSQSAGDGKEALAILEKDRFDLVLMDIRMPELDGYETTIQLRSARNNPNAGVPIIALTASALLDEREKALQVGMNFHLTKPFTPDQLSKAIRELFQVAQTRSAGLSNLQLPEPFKVEELEELYEGDWEHALIMFDLFIRNIPEELQQMEAAVASEDWPRLGDLAHRIKPNFRMVGRGDLVKPAQRIEEAARSEKIEEELLRNRWKSFHRAVRGMLPALGLVVQNIQNYLKKEPHEMSDRG